MSWATENKFLTGYIVVMALSAGALGYQVFSASSAYDGATEKYKAKAQAYNNLRKVAPYPNRDNLAKLEAQKNEAAAVLNAFQADLAKREFPLTPMSPADFQETLRKTVNSVRAKADGAGVRLGKERDKDKFYLGFQRYETAPPDQSVSTALGRDLKTIEWVVEQLVATPVISVNEIKRPELPQESRKPATPPPRAQGPAGRGPGPAGTPQAELVTAHSFDISFSCRQQQLAKVLNVLVNPSAPQFLIPKNVKVVNSSPKAPARIDPAAALGSPEPAPAPAPAAGATPAPGIPAAPVAPAPSSTTIKYLLGEETIDATITLEIVDFADPAPLEPAATKPAPPPIAFMDWIKKRYDQFILVLVAIALLAFAVLVYLKTGSFQERFAEAAASVPISTKIPEPDFGPVDVAKESLTNPPKWEVPRDFDAGAKGSLFVSQFYIVGPLGIPAKPGVEALRFDSLTKKPIPNRWFMDRGISFLEGAAATLDPDKDGFANEDEWRADTDPNKADSHPPYYTKLFFKQIIRIPFRLIFSSTNGDPKKPETLEFQINTVDLRQPSEFLKINDMVPNTKFKLVKFDFKERLNAKTESMEDVSELTLTNVETNDPIVLVINKVTDSPDVYALFDYQWPGGAGDIRVKKLGEFALKPQADKNNLYKVIEVTDSQAVIQLPSGEKHTVVRDPRKSGG